MKFATCVAVFLISSVSCLEWLARRDAAPDNTCRNIYTRIDVILRKPNFRYILRDGELSLDCSEQTLERADECLNTSFEMCRRQMPSTRLNAAYHVFCRHRTDIEAEPECWTSDNLIPAVLPCQGREELAFALCAEQNVTNLAECSATAGAIWRRLMLEVFS